MPMGGSREGFARQIAGSFLTFAFIWLWHGGNMHIMWWCIPNWLGVVVESLAGIVLLLPSVKRLEVGFLRLVRTAQEEFENPALFLRLRLPSTLIRHENGAIPIRSFKYAFSNFFSVMWTEALIRVNTPMSHSSGVVCIVSMQTGSLVSRDFYNEPLPSSVFFSIRH